MICRLVAEVFSGIQMKARGQEIMDTNWKRAKQSWILMDHREERQVEQGPNGKEDLIYGLHCTHRMPFRTIVQYALARHSSISLSESYSALGSCEMPPPPESSWPSQVGWTKPDQSLAAICLTTVVRSAINYLLTYETASCFVSHFSSTAFDSSSQKFTEWVNCSELS